MFEREPDRLRHAVGQAPPRRRAAQATGQAIGEIPPGHGEAVGDVEGLSPGDARREPRAALHRQRCRRSRGPAIARPPLIRSMWPPDQRPRDLADDLLRTGTVDRRRAKDDDVQAVLALGAAHLGLPIQLGLRVPVAEAPRDVGLVDPPTARGDRRRRWCSDGRRARTEESAHASSRRRVPATLTRLISSTVAQSETRAPQWKTKRQPSTARVERSRRRQVADAPDRHRAPRAATCRFRRARGSGRGSLPPPVAAPGIRRRIRSHR